MTLAYISAFVPLEGVSLIDAFGGEAPDWYDVKVGGLRPLFDPT